MRCALTKDVTATGSTTLRAGAESVDITARGRVLFGEAHFGGESEDVARQRQMLEQAVRANLLRLPDTFVTAIDAVHRESGGRFAQSSWRRASRRRMRSKTWKSAAPRSSAKRWT